jgi:Uma2 family endonuclease
MAVAQLTPTTPAAPPLSGMTADEFLEFSGGESYLELVRGVVVQLSPASILLGRTAKRVHRTLDDFVETRGIGEVIGFETGFVLERGPDTVRAPDVAFLSNERLEAIEDESKFAPLAPDLAVEVLSPTDSVKAAGEKARMYLQTGSAVVWVLKPFDHTLRIYRPNTESQVLGPDDEADAEPVLPGFRCPVRGLFPPA